MTIVSNTPYQASRLQFNGQEDDLGVKFVTMSLWPNLEISRWRLTLDESAGFPVAVGVEFTPLVANPGDPLTLWTDGGDLFFGDSIITGGGGGTFTNSTPTPVTLGGIPAGSTFSSATLQQMFDALLYPYLAPAFSAFAISGQVTPLEVGDSIPQVVTFTWGTTNSSNVALNSISILDITLSTTLASSLTNDGSQLVAQASAITNVVAATHVYRISATNTEAGTFTRDATYTWRWRAYYGFGAFAVPTENQIEALASNALLTALAGTYAMGATGYKFICQANAVGGQINDVKDAATLLSVPMATVADNAAYSNVDGGGTSYALVSVTNSFGVTANYRVYRTANALGSSINLVVS